MGQELYNDGSHICIVFRDLVSGEATQANQVVIFDHDRAALLDPGGELTYTRLFMEISNYTNVKKLDYVVASHQDPDIVASVNQWLAGTDCRVVIPALWERFIPHLTRPGKLADRVISIPDAGLNLRLGDTTLQALPAHFLHAEGNYSFFDPVSRILLSGDIGANFPPGELDQPITQVSSLIPFMDAFHRRYMNSNKVCRFWVNMVRELDVETMVPQHGRAFRGKKVVNAFLDWLETLQCGIDLIDQELYRVPRMDA
jgi:flavorubredoxin